MIRPMSFGFAFGVVAIAFTWPLLNGWTGPFIEFLFVLGALSASCASFCFLAAIIVGISSYTHRAERDRVSELNRHAGMWNWLLGRQWRLYTRTKGNHSAEAQKEWEKMNAEFRQEEQRHRAADQPIMQRHQASELVRFIIFCFVLGVPTCVAIVGLFTVKP